VGLRTTTPRLTQPHEMLQQPTEPNQQRTCLNNKQNRINNKDAATPNQIKNKYGRIGRNTGDIWGPLKKLKCHFLPQKVDRFPLKS
jgi:hypothetical protein